MTSADHQVAGDTDAQLRELVQRGFQFVHPTDSDGELTAIVGVRVHHDVIDVVRLHDEDDVHAMRLPSDASDILAPNRVLWQTSGFVGTVLAEVLELPDEAAEQPEQRWANGCWIPVKPGNSRWVSAST